MARKVKMLDETTINQIAAGEVIQGPYSVIKELVENAIDANATKIFVEIKNGGKSYIRITDNGVGIDVEDIEMVFERHSTSKINEIEDLDSLMTLGFRGEALASIASVSQIEVTSKTKGKDTGVSMELSGGEILSKKEVSATQGTTVIIKNLFFNTPARRKFMKSVKAETTRINEVITRLAISKSNISFKYVNNNNIMFTTPGDNELSKVLLSIFPKDLYQNMIRLNSNKVTPYKVTGFISQPMYGRGNRNLEIFFVNNRLVKSINLSKALEKAYENKLMIHRFPICILNIEVPPGEIDVNIHPSKTEIKFYEEKSVGNFIIEEVSKALSVGTKIVKPDLTKEESALEDSVIKSSKEVRHPSKNSEIDTKEPCDYYYASKSNILSSQREAFSTSSTAKKSQDSHQTMNYKNDTLSNNSLEERLYEKLQQDQKQMKTDIEEIQESMLSTKEDHLPFSIDPTQGFHILGQAFQSYILFESQNSLFLVDQHAAHERVLFDQLYEDAKENRIIRQRLLKPESIRLSPEDYSLFQEYHKIFDEAGFTIESFGKDTLIIREVPLALGRPKNSSFIMDILDGIRGQDSLEDEQALVIQKACKNAIKANKTFSQMEIKELLHKLQKITPPLHCPHGRPIILKVEEKDLAKYFKRIT